MSPTLDRPCRSLVTLLVFFGLFPLAGLATAGQGASASIIGQVTDESGGVLPGVTVTATSPALQVPEVTSVTDERGEYRLTPLPIGTFQVVYGLSGFQTLRRESVRLTVGFVARLDVALKVGALEESVTVTGASPVVDVTSTAPRTQFTRETLELVPTSRNGLIGLLAQAPGVRTNFDVGGTSLNAGPQMRAFAQSGESWATLEGVVTGNNSSGSASNFWDYSALDEAQVSTVGADAEMPTRGIQVIALVKSGGNNFHGGASWAQTGEKLQADNIDDELAALGITHGNPISKRYDGGGELGGRLVRDKLWFYGNGRLRRNDDLVLNAVKPDGSPFVDQRMISYYNIKLSSQISRSNRVIFFNQTMYKRDIIGATQFLAFETHIDRPTLLFVPKLEWQAVRGNSLVMSFQYGYFGYRNHWRSTSDQPAARDIRTLRVWGEAAAAGQRAHNRWHHPKGSVSWYQKDLFIGNHEFKGGFDYVVGTEARSQDSKRYNYQLVFNNGVPFQLDTYNYPVEPGATSHYLGGYLKDNWTVARRLTLNVGLRYAHDNGFVPARCRDAADFAEAACFPKVQFKIWNTVAPRLHAAYDFTGDGKTVIKGGWGRFDHMRYADLEIASADPNVATTTTWRWLDRNGNNLYDAGEVNLNPNGPDFVQRSGFVGAEPNPNEKQPKVDEFTVSFERELASSFAARVTGVYSRIMNTYRYLNTRRPYEAYSVPVTNADPGPDGRIGSADDPGTFITYYEYPAALAGRQFELNTLINDPKAEQKYKSFEVAAFKRLSSGWQFMASYAATKKDVPILRGLAPSGAAPIIAGDANPNAEIFPSDRTWEKGGKISGAYVFAATDVTVSASFDHRSGDPWARQVLFTGGRTIPSIVLKVEPIGTRRLPNLNLLDLRVQKMFRLGAGQRVTLQANLFNALNANTVTSLTVRSGASFMRPTGIMPPRILEFSAAYAF